MTRRVMYARFVELTGSAVAVYFDAECTRPEGAVYPSLSAFEKDMETQRWTIEWNKTKGIATIDMGK